MKKIQVRMDIKDLKVIKGGNNVTEPVFSTRSNYEDQEQDGSSCSCPNNCGTCDAINMTGTSQRNAATSSAKFK